MVASSNALVVVGFQVSILNLLGHTNLSKSNYKRSKSNVRIYTNRIAISLINACVFNGGKLRHCFFVVLSC